MRRPKKLVMYAESADLNLSINHCQHIFASGHILWLFSWEAPRKAPKDKWCNYPSTNRTVRFSILVHGISKTVRKIFTAQPFPNLFCIKALNVGAVIPGHAAHVLKTALHVPSGETKEVGRVPGWGTKE